MPALWLMLETTHEGRPLAGPLPDDGQSPLPASLSFSQSPDENIPVCEECLRNDKVGIGAFPCTVCNYAFCEDCAEFHNDACEYQIKGTITKPIIPPLKLPIKDISTIPPHQATPVALGASTGKSSTRKSPTKTMMDSIPQFSDFMQVDDDDFEMIKLAHMQSLSKQLEKIEDNPFCYRIS